VTPQTVTLVPGSNRRFPGLIATLAQLPAEKKRRRRQVRDKNEENSETCLGKGSGFSNRKLASQKATEFFAPSGLCTRHWYRPFASAHESTSASQSLSSAALTKPITVATTATDAAAAGAGAGAGDADADADVPPPLAPPGFIPEALATSLRRPIIICVSGCSLPRTFAS